MILGAVVALASVYVGAGVCVAWAFVNARPWRRQHWKHHRDGRVETYRDHPVRNTVGVVLNALGWPILLWRAFREMS